MNLCQACKRQCDLFLCTDCTGILADMFSQLPWLIEELDIRIQRLDRISQGTIGRARSIDPPAIIDFDACETARELRKELRHWVETVAKRHTGRTPPGLDTVTTADLARWLQLNTEAIARLDIAGGIFHDLKKRVGTDQRGGQLVKAINRTARHFAGPCPTVRGHNQRGEDIECGEILYADEDETTVTCPRCRQDINVERNRLRANVERDLMTEPKILETMTNLDEKISRVTFYRWVREKRIRPKGWIHDGRIMPMRIRRGDPAVYSLARARKLRTREIQAKTAAQTGPVSPRRNIR